MIGVILGFMLNVKFGIRPSHYGISLISCIFGGMVAMRQTLLHIVPGTGSYGTAVWGLHLYTWAFIVFSATILIIGILMMFDKNQFTEAPEKGNKLVGFSKIVFIFMIVLTVANAVTAFFECGIATPCPDDPDSYKVIQELEHK